MYLNNDCPLEVPNSEPGIKNTLLIYFVYFVNLIE